MSSDNKKWGIIGAGNMASAMLTGALKNGVLSSQDVIASRRDPSRRKALESEFGIETTDDNAAVIERSQTILLAIKPQQCSAFLNQFGSQFRAGQTLVSVLAGITTTSLRFAIPKDVRIIRTMPNTPSVVGRGVTLITGDAVPSEVSEFLEASGSVIPIDEEQFDHATAISGCGPAYVFLLAEALTDAGISQGLDTALAKQLAYETLYGAATLLELRANEMNAEELRERVTSPGGATAAAVGVLQARGMSHLIRDAVGAARRRATTLGQG